MPAAVGRSSFVSSSKPRETFPSVLSEANQSNSASVPAAASDTMRVPTASLLYSTVTSRKGSPNRGCSKYTLGELRADHEGWQGRLGALQAVAEERLLATALRGKRIGDAVEHRAVNQR